MASLIQDTPGFESYAKLVIAASEASIARIQSQIRDLERLCDRERGTIAQLRMAIAPVRKLPAELLIEVFRHTCDRYTFDNTSTIKKVQVLSHVCAYWRRVAITTPQLWTDTVDIRLEKTPTDAYLAGLKEWLNRSAPLPIRVNLECPKKNVASAAVVGALITTAHRWSSASFTIPSLSILADIPSTALKQLRTLWLESEDAANPPAMLALSLAPNLGMLTLDTRRPARLTMPWSQLTRLRVVTNSAQECLDTLLQCPNLVSVDLSIPAWPELPDLSEIRPTTLGRLETFDLKFDYDKEGVITPLFTSLTLPALKRLIIQLDLENEWPSTEFTHFQIRAPNLEYLSLSSSTEINSADLLAILRHAPALSVLDLEYCRRAFDDSIITALSSSHQTPAQLVPRLQNLSVLGYSDDFEEDMLESLVAARWWTDAQLASFPLPPHVSRWSSLYISRDERFVVSPELTAKLEEYRRQGLTVKFS